eukprot:2024863-Rhodomonas_salina.1
MLTAHVGHDDAALEHRPEGDPTDAQQHRRPHALRELPLVHADARPSRGLPAASAGSVCAGVCAGEAARQRRAPAPSAAAAGGVRAPGLAHQPVHAARGADVRVRAPDAPARGWRGLGRAGRPAAVPDQ